MLGFSEQNEIKHMKCQYQRHHSKSPVTSNKIEHRITIFWHSFSCSHYLGLFGATRWNKTSNPMREGTNHCEMVSSLVFTIFFEVTCTFRKMWQLDMS